MMALMIFIRTAGRKHEREGDNRQGKGEGGEGAG